jgi:hypothetical protein
MKRNGGNERSLNIVVSLTSSCPLHAFCIPSVSPFWAACKMPRLNSLRSDYPLYFACSGMMDWTAVPSSAGGLRLFPSNPAGLATLRASLSASLPGCLGVASCCSWPGASTRFPLLSRLPARISAVSFFTVLFFHRYCASAYARAADWRGSTATLGVLVLPTQSTVDCPAAAQWTDLVGRMCCLPGSIRVRPSRPRMHLRCADLIRDARYLGATDRRPFASVMTMYVSPRDLAPRQFLSFRNAGRMACVVRSVSLSSPIPPSFLRCTQPCDGAVPCSDGRPYRHAIRVVEDNPNLQCASAARLVSSWLIRRGGPHHLTLRCAVVKRYSPRVHSVRR